MSPGGMAVTPDYAHSPLEDRGRVEISVPEYGPVVVPVSRSGSFHRVEEQTGSVLEVAGDQGLR